ncbi:MAG: HEAT repeat domain-containing protein [Pirellulales bacterium]
MIVYFEALACSGPVQVYVQNIELQNTANELTSVDPSTRAFAAFRLGEAGSRSKRHIGALVKVLSDRDPRVRVEAAYAICRIDPSLAAGHVPVIAAEIKSDTSLARRTAIIYLGRLGKVADCAVQELSALIDLPEFYDRVLVAAAVMRIRPEIAGAKMESALVSGLADDRFYVRTEALEGIARGGRRFRDIRSKVAKLEGDEVESVRIAARAALIAIDQD